MSLLNQTNFPRLWRLFQWSIGGGCHKRHIVRERLGDRRNVLEVGCSVGNIAETLRSVPGLRYTGVDIDGTALQTARRAFRHEPLFQFHQGEIEQLELPESSFDFIILSAVLHHVDDAGCRRILDACSNLLASRWLADRDRTGSADQRRPTARPLLQLDRAGPIRAPFAGI